MNVNDLTIVLLVLAATWAGMFHVLKVVEINNAKRDLILKINQDGNHLSKDQRKTLLYSDFVPIWIGIMLFLLVYSGAFVALPHILSYKLSNPTELTRLEILGCYGAAGIGVFALVVEIIAGSIEIRMMRAFIESDSAKPE